MADEYDYLYNHTPHPNETDPVNAPNPFGAPQADPGMAQQPVSPQPDDSSDYGNFFASSTMPSDAPDYTAPQNDYAYPAQGAPDFQPPQSDFTQTQQNVQPDFTQAQQNVQPDFTQAQQNAQPDFTQAQQNAQPEPETVHAEPAPEYSAPSGYYTGYPNVPPYGQRNAAAGGYGGQPPYSGTQSAYGSAYRPPQPQQTPPKKEKKGLKIFFRILIAVIIIGLVFTVVRLALDRPQSAIPQAGETSGATAVTPEANAPEMETKASPSSDSIIHSGKALTPTQIAAKVRGASVGILVYSGNSSGTAGQGSGVLWKESTDGKYTYIITCAHVVSGSGYTYSVQTEDSKTYDAELVGADAKTDLAVLRIEASGLSLAEFGDSSALQVGDPVYAIGNPGGTEFFGSFTSGIVSAIDRSVKNTYTMLCIQHTAAINPGNSGGALVNQYGQVIGINSQKIASTDYEGMGFAIPMKSAQNIINALASYGFVKDRPRLGITYAEGLNYQQYSIIIKVHNLPSGSLIISEIANDSSLANTEVKTGDMIIKVNGEDMTTPNVLLDKIENGKVGDKLTLTLCRVDRNYQVKQFTVTATLVEETRQTEQKESTTTQQYYFDPFDFFNGNFGNFYGGSSGNGN